jgi:transglutaminase-like putative cysteine protease
MRLRVTHETTYTYRTPANSVTQLLHMEPRGHDGQFVVEWRVEIDHDSRLWLATDAFGNNVHSFTLAGPVSSLTITAAGEVETDDTNGVVRGQIERFSPTVFLRETALTKCDGKLRRFADKIAAAEAEPIPRLHALNAAILDRMRYDPAVTDTTTPAAESFLAGHGVCQDFAHIFIAAARHLGIPARYVGGYLFQPDATEQEAGPGWAEALVEGVGWIAFDPAHGRSANDAYVRVAVGLDYLGAAPVRGARHGGGDEKMSVRVTLEDIGSPRV